MEIEYKNKTVKRMCEDYSFAKKEFGEKIARSLAMLMVDLTMYRHMSSFYSEARLQKYRMHDLVGQKKGVKSLRIDFAYRMELEVLIEAISDDGEDRIRILEVSKHYGD